MLNVWVFDKGSLLGSVFKNTAEQVGIHVHLVSAMDGDFSDPVISNSDELDDCIDYLVLILGQGGQDDNWLSQGWLEGFKEFSTNLNIPVIIQSSAAVFSGETSYSFLELDTPSPSSPYGQYCLSVERMFAHHVNSLVIRTGWLFSDCSSDWFMQVIRDVESGSRIDYPADQLVQPTSNKDLSRVLVAVIEQLSCCNDPGLWSTYHYASVDQVSKNRFFQTILNEMANYTDISETILESTPYRQRIALDDFSQNTVLDCTKILSVFGIKQRAWKKEISAIIARKFSETESK